MGATTIDLVVRGVMDIAGIQAGAGGVMASMRGIQGAGMGLSSVFAGLAATGTAATLAIGAGVIAATGLIMKATSEAAAWETALTRVAKTTGIEKNSQAYASLSSDLQDLRIMAGITRDEAAAAAEIAGSVGIGQEFANAATLAAQAGNVDAATKSWNEYSNTLAEASLQATQMAGAFGMSTAEVMESMGQLGATTRQKGQSWSDFFKREGSVIDEMGNSLATSEAKITSGMLHASSAFALYKPTDEVLYKWTALMGTMQSVGFVNAGEGIKDLMNYIQRPQLQTSLSKLLGITPEQFQAELQRDAPEMIAQVAQMYKTLDTAQKGEIDKLSGDTGRRVWQYLQADAVQTMYETSKAKALRAGEEGTGLKESYDKSMAALEAQFSRTGQIFQTTFEKIGTTNLGELTKSMEEVNAALLKTQPGVVSFGEGFMGIAASVASATARLIEFVAVDVPDWLDRGGLIGILEDKVRGEEHKPADYKPERISHEEAVGLAMQGATGYADYLAGALETELPDSITRAYTSSQQVTEAVAKAAGETDGEAWAKGFDATFKSYTSAGMSRELALIKAASEDYSKLSDLELLNKWNAANKDDTAENPVDKSPWYDRPTPTLTDYDRDYIDGSTQAFLKSVRVPDIGSVTSVNQMKDALEAYGATAQQAGAIIEGLFAEDSKYAKYMRQDWGTEWEVMKASNDALKQGAEDRNTYLQEYLNAPEVEWENNRFSKWVESLPVDLQQIKDFDAELQRTLYNIYEGTDISGTTDREGGLLAELTRLYTIGDDVSAATADNIANAWSSVLEGLTAESLSYDEYNILTNYIDFLATQGADQASLDALKEYFAGQIRQTFGEIGNVVSEEYQKAMDVFDSGEIWQKFMEAPEEAQALMDKYVADPATWFTSKLQSESGKQYDILKDEGYKVEETFWTALQTGWEQHKNWFTDDQTVFMQGIEDYIFKVYGSWDAFKSKGSIQDQLNILELLSGKATEVAEKVKAADESMSTTGFYSYEEDDSGLYMPSWISNYDTLDEYVAQKSDYIMRVRETQQALSKLGGVSVGQSYTGDAYAEFDLDNVALKGSDSDLHDKLNSAKGLLDEVQKKADPVTVTANTIPFFDQLQAIYDSIQPVVIPVYYEESWEPTSTAYDFDLPAVKSAPTADQVFGVYSEGTEYVPRTGPYLLHEGEAVVTAEENRGGRKNITYAPAHTFVIQSGSDMSAVKSEIKKILDEDLRAFKKEIIEGT